MEQKQQLLLEQGAGRLWRWLRPYRWAFFGALVCGLLAHMFAFTNKLVNHDEVQCLFSKGATVDSGRWGLGALDSILPNFSMPWIYGVMTIVLIALAVCLMADLFSVRSRLLQVLLGGCVLTFPALTGTFGYMFTSSAYGIAFFLAVLAVWLLGRKDWLGAILGLGAMILSLSIYQAYIAVAASLLVLVLIQRLLEEDKTALVFRQGVWFVGFLVVSLGLYYLATQLVLKITGTSFNSYAGANVAFHLADIPGKILLAYKTFAGMFLWGAFGIMPTGFLRLLYVVLALSAGILGLLWIFGRKRQPMAVVLLVVLCALLPLAINCMFLFTTEESIHTLVEYSVIAVYLLAAVLVQALLQEPVARKAAEHLRRWAMNGATLALACILAGNVYLANIAYLNMHLRYENAYAFYTTVLTAAQQTPGYEKDTPLAVVGSWERPWFYEVNFEQLVNLTGVGGFLPDEYSAPSFVQYYIGMSVPFATEQEKQQLQSTPAFQQMPVYPASGSIAMIDGCLVVKLSYTKTQ